MATPINNSAPLSDAERLRIQQIAGTFLFYARCVDPTIRVALSSIAETQSKPTQATAKAAHMLLDYLATHPDAIIR